MRPDDARPTAALIAHRVHDTSVKRYPAVPTIDDPSATLEGHLWVQELVVGGHLRFSMQPSGALQFGDRDRVFDAADDVPLAYRHAVRHVRERLDRETLREAVEDPSSVTFFAEAMHHASVAYDWDRTPDVLGFDVYDGSSGRFLPPDAVERVFERLGLEPVNAFRKEVRAADFNPDPTDVPESAWRDDHAAGRFLRTKTGGRATLPNPAVEREMDPEPLTGDAEELAARYATDERFARVADRLEGRGDPVTFDALFERTWESILRERHGRLMHGQTDVTPGEFRSAVAARAREWHGERE
jgi:hypothetical protein